jgi:hypothetical protein
MAGNARPPEESLMTAPRSPSARVRCLAAAFLCAVLCAGDLVAQEAGGARAEQEPSAADAADADATLALGRRHTGQFYAGESDALWEEVGPDMRAAFGGDPAVLVLFKDQVLEGFGSEAEVVSENVSSQPGSEVYLRTARFEQTDQLIELIITYDEAGVIIGFLIRPKPVEAPSRFLDYQTKTPLRLPFEGPWLIFWGGRTLEQNYHTFTQDQRFAYDILIMEDGSSHTGDGTRNDQYHAFGKPVVAPGPGRVVSAAKDVADNVPGEMNPAQAMGNHVILDHGNGEFSFLAHFQQGTLQVEVGDEVKAGDLLGMCGNSGNTTEAHIHYHLQTTPDFNAGEGLPAQFLGYELVEQGEGPVRDEGTHGAKVTRVERGEPVQGQVVRPGARAAPARR